MENVGEEQQVGSYVRTNFRKMVFSDSSIEFYYFDDGETVLRAYRDSGEAKASAQVGECFQSFY